MKNSRKINYLTKPTNVKKIKMQQTLIEKVIAKQNKTKKK